jgi:type I restriction enzyme S subunit
VLTHNDQCKAPQASCGFQKGFCVTCDCPYPPNRNSVAEIETQITRLDNAHSALFLASAKIQKCKAAILRSLFLPFGRDELPSGWTWRSIGEVFQVFVGSTPSRNHTEYWNGGIPWASSGEVAFCRIYRTRETISQAGLANSSVKIHPPGTVLLGMIGEGKTRGQVAILNVSAGHNQNSAAIRVSEAKLPAEYLYWYLTAEYQRTRNIGSGNNQPALNKARVQAIRFPFAPPDEQFRIANLIETKMSVLDAIGRETQDALSRVTALRQAILKKAFSGQLVAQDPNDEPTSLLLERIRAAQTPAAPVRRPSKRARREVHA